MPLDLSDPAVKKNAEIQAFTHLAGFGPAFITGARHQMTNDAIRHYALANPTPELGSFTEETDFSDEFVEQLITPLHEHLINRALTDPAFRSQLRLNALAALESGDAHAVRAAQIYMNFEKCSDVALEIDGDPGPLTHVCGGVLEGKIEAEKQAAAERTRQLEENNARILELETEVTALQEDLEQTEEKLAYQTSRAEQLEEDLEHEHRFDSAADKIASLSMGDVEGDNRSGTKRLSAAFESVAPGALYGAEDQKAKDVRRQYKGANAYVDFDRGKPNTVEPHKGDILFVRRDIAFESHGHTEEMRSFRQSIGVINAIDRDGNIFVSFSNKDGSEDIELITPQELREGRYENGKIEGFGDTSEFLERHEQLQQSREDAQRDARAEGPQAGDTVHYGWRGKKSAEITGTDKNGLPTFKDEDGRTLTVMKYGNSYCAFEHADNRYTEAFKIKSFGDEESAPRIDKPLNMGSPMGGAP